jgi:hypothetical protein
MRTCGVCGTEHSVEDLPPRVAASYERLLGITYQEDPVFCLECGAPMGDQEVDYAA